MRAIPPFQSTAILFPVLLVFTLLVACSENAPETQSRANSDMSTVAVQPVEGTDGKLQSATQLLNNWLDKEFEDFLDFSPQAKTRLGLKSDYALLDDASELQAKKIVDWRRKSVAEMQSRFERDELDAQGKLSWDLWVFMLHRAEAGEAYFRHQFIFGRRGPHTELPNLLINYHKVDNLSDMQAYISRLEQSGPYLLQHLERAKLSAREGIRAPYFDYDISMSHGRRVITGEPFDSDGESALWSDITAKILALGEAGEVTESQALDLRKQAKAALLESLQPAYEQILTWQALDLDNVSEIAEGAWALPEGASYYKYRLEQMTTLPLSAAEIHETGLAEVARIQREMEVIMGHLEFEGSLADFLIFMREDDQFYFPNTDEGREGYLEMARRLLAKMEVKLPEYFGILPKAALEVRRVEAYREQPGAAAHYRRGSTDRTRPAVFYAHLADMRATAKYRLENLAYHEGVPGHHMQIAIQQELENIPRFRTYHGYTAFSEGWALYAEYLGKDMGFYTDYYADFGRLSGEIWRAIRLVVDTGIHDKQWSEAQAIDYATRNSPRPVAAIKSEIRRYFNGPAQATAYKIGMIKIMELRKRAQDKLKEKFDIRAFHDAILGNGPLPLPVLETYIDDWIAAQI